MVKVGGAVIRKDVRAFVSEVQKVLGGVQDVHDFINIHAIIEWDVVDSERCQT